MNIQFGDVEFDLPEGWFDVTEDLSAGGPPTLARSSGIGVIQFSTARYRGGANPNATISDLTELLSGFWDRNELQCDSINQASNQFAHRVWGIVSSNDQYICACYISDGRNFSLVTYTAEEGQSEELMVEMTDFQHIVSTLRF